MSVEHAALWLVETAPSADFVYVSDNWRLWTPGTCWCLLISVSLFPHVKRPERTPHATDPNHESIPAAFQWRHFGGCGLWDRERTIRYTYLLFSGKMAAALLTAVGRFEDVDTCLWITKKRRYVLDNAKQQNFLSQGIPLHLLGCRQWTIEFALNDHWPCLFRLPGARSVIHFFSFLPNTPEI